MAFAGFGKSSGPSIPPKAPTSFGTSSSSSPPPNPKPSSDSKITFPAIQPPIQQQQTPPSAKRRVMPLDWEYQPKQSSNISYNLSPQKLSFVAASVTAHNVDANISVRPDNPRTISSFDIRPAMPPSWHNQPMPPTNLSYVTHPQRLSPVAVSGIARDVDATISIKPDVLNFAKRNRSPPLTSREDEILELYSPPNANARRPVTPHSWHNQLKQPTSLPYRTSSQRMSPIRSSGIARDAGVYISTQNDNLNAFRSTRSPPLPSHEDDILGLYNPPNANARGLATSPSLSSHMKEPVNIPSMNNQRLSPIATNSYPHDAAANFRDKPINLHVAKRNRSPPLLSHDDDILDMYNHNGNGRRIDDPLKWTRSSSDVNSQSVHSLEVSVETAQSHDESGPRTGTQRSPVITAASHQMNPVITSAEALSPIPPASLGAPKRSRSPPLQSADVSSTSSSIQLDSEREIQAKAKRLARFNIELSKPLQTPNDLSRHKFSGNKQDQVLSDKQRSAKGHDDEAWEGTGMAILSDYEGMESSKVVVGKCTDMCPESEREERERKGDLDKFERLNGERNQTTKFLAVKKYNRTAEREADLIRPLPVLRETVDYLLNLLDQPYNENFLGIYNFLWDRMRAVRMDLRMQHIFNQEAILMLEQMIRLHIVAMHELCEYRKGESFVEGFDAHLNIEQMNKTSVELFQMYDDHRKRGKGVSTEKEFRGYYALLKLDKHPGYKVEPSELSLDLAKMTPEMRCTPEILFARAVARACRFGNFIAFFRLARKATYLQACLMHAHFAKLRTQALASLHGGLQNNQGIPVSHVVKWLGMEGEDIESLLEYHGFSLRRYEELYMVKEGLFLNIDADYPTTRSQLVHLKKSRSIADDVKSGPAISQLTEERKNESALRMADLRTKPFMTVDEEMLEFKVDSVPRVVSQPRHLFEEPLPTIWNRNYDHELPDASLSIWNMDKDREMIEACPIETTCLSEDDSFSDKEQHTGIVKDISVNLPAWPAPEGMVQAGVPASSDLDFIVANPAPRRNAEENQENEVSIVVHHRKNEETIKEKLKIILRKWKERASKLRETREQREFLANAAFSSLSLGPPVRRQNGVSYAAEVLNIDYVARERCGKLEKSWATLNISELTQPILCTRNPDAKCISWKLLFLVQGNGTENHAYNLAMKWLHSKIMGSDVETDGELLVSLPNLSIWKNRTSPEANEMEVCCLAIVRQTRLGEDDLIDGSSSLLFLASGSISWDIQRVQLHKLLASIPYGVNLPLLILITDTYEESVNIINKLGLHEADTTKISCLSVVFLCGNSYFDDDQLKEGLKWLASNSPLQPMLHSVSTRELALRYLKRTSSVLENTDASDVNPNHCIAAFNEALDHSCEEIIAAASINPNHWPSPEINLLEKSSDVCLPSVGWSSPERIEPIIMAIKGCRLPPFPGDMSFLNEGSTTIRELQNKKLAVEECLINYLTKSTQLLNLYLAEKEANVMLQKGAGLELRGSCHYIVPRWSVIFQRIYNWRLMRLRGDKCSRAYIVARKDETDVSNNGDVISPLEFSQTEISLEELMEISCIVQIAKEPESVFKRQYSPPVIISNEAEEGKKFACGVSATVDGERNEERVSPLSSKKDNRLDMLLEQCNQLQDMIQTKLSIYF